METPPAAGDIPVLQAQAPAPPPLRARRRNALWYVALLIALVVTLGGFGLLYTDDVSWQHQAADLSRQNATLHQQLLTTQAGLTTAEGTIQELRNEAKHPNLGIWNVQQHIDGPDYYLAGGVPDTFTYHLVASSSGPMSVSILTFEQFASAVDCVHAGTGSTHYCMNHQPGTFKTWENVTSVNYDFHQAEGCANYLVVFTSGAHVTVTPNVSVTYNPAPTFTGDC